MDGTYRGTISWFKNPNAKVSAHYLISKEGEIRRMVKEKYRAWHAGSWNSRSIGIELEDERMRSAWRYTQAQIDALKWLVKDIESRWGSLKYVLHKDISSSRSDPVGNFTLDWVINSSENMDKIKQKSSYFDRIAHYFGYDDSDKVGYDDIKKKIEKIKTDNENHRNGYMEFKEKYRLAQTKSQEELAVKEAECQRKIGELRDSLLSDFELKEEDYKGRIKDLEQKLKDGVDVVVEPYPKIQNKFLRMVFNFIISLNEALKNGK